MEHNRIRGLVIEDVNSRITTIFQKHQPTCSNIVDQTTFLRVKNETVELSIDIITDLVKINSVCRELEEKYFES